MFLNKNKLINTPKKSEHNFPKETILMKKKGTNTLKFTYIYPCFNITLIYLLIQFIL